MRSKTHGSNIAELVNGCQIRGTYGMSLGGAHVSVYVVSPLGLVLAHRNYAFGRITGEEPADKMLTLIGAYVQMADRLGFDVMLTDIAQLDGAKTLARALSKETVFKTIRIEALASA